jgi:hypothetical protein
MAEPVADHLQVDTNRQREARVGVPQVMEAYQWEPVPTDQATEQGGNGIGPQKRPVLPGEDEAKVVPTSSPARPFGQLTRLVSTQDLYRPGVYRHEPGTGSCLGGTEPRTLPCIGHLARYVNRPGSPGGLVTRPPRWGPRSEPAGDAARTQPGAGSGSRSAALWRCTRRPSGRSATRRLRGCARCGHRRRWPRS